MWASKTKYSDRVNENMRRDQVLDREISVTQVIQESNSMLFGASDALVDADRSVGPKALHSSFDDD